MVCVLNIQTGRICLENLNCGVLCLSHLAALCGVRSRRGRHTPRIFYFAPVLPDSTSPLPWHTEQMDTLSSRPYCPHLQVVSEIEWGMMAEYWSQLFSVLRIEVVCDKKRDEALSGGDDLPTRTCLSPRISFMPLQNRKHRKKCLVPISWMHCPGCYTGTTIFSHANSLVCWLLLLSPARPWRKQASRRMLLQAEAPLESTLYQGEWKSIPINTFWIQKRKRQMKSQSSKTLMPFLSYSAQLEIKCLGSSPKAQDPWQWAQVTTVCSELSLL